MNIKDNKNIVIIGPTSSGKTGMAVRMAYDFTGEIISADSRQVYKGMDVGTGKDLDEYEFYLIKDNKKIKIKIPYHLIDIVSPNTIFDLAKFVEKAKLAIIDIHNREKLPIIAGGTGLYTQALVDGFKLSKITPNQQLREELEELSVKPIYLRLKKLNKEFAENLNDGEKNNKRRLIRYIELEKSKLKQDSVIKKDINSRKNYLLIGIKCSREILYERINQRLLVRIKKEGMIDEVERLHKVNHVTWQRLSSFGLEYKYVSLYLQGRLEYEQMIEDLAQAIRKFSKRQMTWYRRWEAQGAEIQWVENYNNAKEIAIKYLKK